MSIQVNEFYRQHWANAAGTKVWLILFRSCKLQKQTKSGYSVEVRITVSLLQRDKEWKGWKPCAGNILFLDLGSGCRDLFCLWNFSMIHTKGHFFFVGILSSFKERETCYWLKEVPFLLPKYEIYFSFLKFQNMIENHYPNGWSSWVCRLEKKPTDTSFSLCFFLQVITPYQLRQQWGRT